MCRMIDQLACRRQRMNSQLPPGQSAGEFEPTELTPRQRPEITRRRLDSHCSLPC
jgi:hypothetical protein